MNKFSRRKFVGTAIIGGVGMGMLPGMEESKKIYGDLHNKTLNGSDVDFFMEPDKSIPGGDISGQDTIYNEFNTMRPVRKKKDIKVTVGQNEGDFRGSDDKIIQAAVDYVAGLGGGTVLILPGVYNMSNSLFPRPGITISGSDGNTILRKNPSVSSRIIRESDWFEYCVKVENPAGFITGGGLALSRDKKNPEEARFFTITAIDKNFLYLDKRTEVNYWMEEEARASTRFSIIYGFNVNDVQVCDLILDGNRTENEHVNDNYAAAVFMQYCDRWNFRNVVARDYNSDGFSFQVCNDIHFEDCSSLNNADLGYHPGSGSQRPVFRHCISKGNSQGFFWCWGACDGIAEDCVASENIKYGINFGHRDTDNIIRNCVIENNGEVGILFREEPNEYRTGDRNLIENCLIRNNGKPEPGFGIDIRYKTNDITVRNCRFENDKNGPQKTAIRISQEAGKINLEGNKFSGSIMNVDDKRKGS
jgi:hypothetical protein